MRATIALGLLTIVVLLGLSPAWLGGKIEAAYQQSLQQWVPASLMTIKSQSYRRGWFESHAAAELALADSLCEAPPCPVLTLKTQLYHGPIPLGASEALGGQLRVLAGAMISTIDPGPLFRAGRIEPGLPPLQGFTRVFLSGASSTRLEMPASGQTLSADSESFSLTSDGLLGVVDHGTAGQLSGNFEMPLLEATGQRGRKALLSGIKVEFDGRAQSAFLGQWSYDIERIRYSDPAAGENYALDQLSLNNETNLADGALSGLLRVQVDRLALPKQTIGASHASIRVERLDAAAVEAIGLDMRALDDEQAPPAMQLFAMLGLYQRHGPDIIARSPEVAIDNGHLLTDAGVADFNVTLQVEPSATLPTTLPGFVAALRGNAQLVADPPVVERWLAGRPNLSLDTLVEENLLQRTPEQQIATEVELKDGQLWVNGVPREQFTQALELLNNEQALVTPTTVLP
ncbi:YdgA family protein [bacterium]|nr:YdgA family protein [bacterium]